jgi:hypothetical protein
LGGSVVSRSHRMATIEVSRAPLVAGEFPVGARMIACRGVQQSDQVLEGVAAAEFSRVNEAHENVTGVGAVERFVE